MTARSRPWIALAAAIAAVGALIHVAAIPGGPAWYAYFGAPLDVVRRPPLLRVGLAVMAASCLLRALILPPLAVTHPELRNTFEVAAAIVWGLAGIGFALGFAAVPRRDPTRRGAGVY